MIVLISYTHALLLPILLLLLRIMTMFGLPCTRYTYIMSLLLLLSRGRRSRFALRHRVPLDPGEVELSQHGVHLGVLRALLLLLVERGTPPTSHSNSPTTHVFILVDGRPHRRRGSVAVTVRLRLSGHLPNPSNCSNSSSPPRRLVGAQV